MNEMAAIRCTNITKTYRLYHRAVDRVKESFSPFGRRYHRPFNALKDVSFGVDKGGTVGIIGRNGSGKSTLLQIMCGILRPTSGTVEVTGRIAALLELGAGFNPEFTGRENVYINAGIMGLRKDEIRDRLSEIISFADIGDFIDQPVKTYSTGMYVRLAFATAINVDPDILILDEAMAVGDILFQAKCFGKIMEFQERGVTIVLVSHALDIITRYCSSAYLLDKGEIRAGGSPKEVVDKYQRMIAGTGKGGPKAQERKELDDEDAVKPVRQWEGLFRINPDESRYGDGKAEVLEAGIFTTDGSPAQTLLQGETYRFCLKVKVNERINSPIFAYTVRDVKGMDICGTNTLYREIATETAVKGDVLLVTFTQRIPLNPGGYLLSFGCAGLEEGEYLVYERRYDYMSFEIVSEKSSVGIVDLDSNVEVTKLR